MKKQIILKSTGKITKLYSGKSKFDFWKNLMIGDEIEITFNLSRYIYRVPTFNILNTRTKESFDSSLSLLQGYLNKIEFDLL